MARIDEVQAVLEQLTLSDFKKWSSTVPQVCDNFRKWKPSKSDEK